MPRFSIRTYFTWVLALALGILTALLTFAVARFYTTSTFDTLSKSNTERLQLVSQKSDALCTGAEAVAQLLYQDDNILGTILSNDISGQNTAAVSASIDLLCAKHYSAFQQFGLTFDVICFSENGFTYSTCGYTEKEFNKLVSYSWFTKERAMKTIDYSVTNFVPLPTEDGSSYCYVLVRNLYHVEGNYAGSIIVFVQEEVFASIYRDFVQTDSTFYLLNEFSTVISSSDKLQIGSSPQALVDYLFVRRDAPYTTNYNEQGVECFYAKYTSPITGWTIFEQIPLNIIMAPVWQIVQNIILTALLIYLGAFVVLFFSTKVVSRPIRQICDGMEHSISNQFAHLKVSTSLTEIHGICNSYNHLCDQANALIVDIRDIEKQANEAKFNFLKAQINPHFLYNTLFAIKCTISMKKLDQASEMLTLLISLLKKTVSSNDLENTLLEETITIQDYVRLQNLRYNGKVLFQMNLPQEIMHFSIPRFLIQPLVENVFLHAVSMADTSIELLIRFRLDQQVLYVEICDTGIGFSNEALNSILEQPPAKDVSHIGLRNIQERINILYGSDYGLSVHNDAHFTTIVRLRLPAHEKGESSLVSYSSSR